MGEDSASSKMVLELINNKAAFVLNINGVTQTLVSNTSISTNIWYHIAGTFDGALMTLYINGVQDTQMSAPGTFDAASSFKIGYDSVASTTSYLDGSLDELRVWSVARTQSQIAANECSVSDTTAELIAYYTFNDCSPDTIAYDNSDNGNDAIAKNMSATDWVVSTTCLTTGIADINAAINAIKLYPNPVGQGNGVTLELTSAIASDYYIYDATGTLIQKQSTDQKLTTINTASLSAGIYLCRVISGNQSYTGKFAVVK